MAVSAKRQKELKALGFLLQNDKEHFAVRILSRAGNFTVDELKSIILPTCKPLFVLNRN